MEPRLSLQKGVIYGPVNSRRLGRSLGINLSPLDYKICSFNCVYCHYGWNKYLKTDLSDYVDDLPTVAQVEEDLEKAIRSMDVPPEYITFSGNGEPTLHPDFEQVVEAVIAVGRRTGAGARLAILSNSTALDDPSVVRALGKLDVRIMKLDAGTDEVLERINHPAAGISVDGIVNGLKRLEDVTLQSVFVGGEVTNAGDEDVEAWLARLEEVRPSHMQVYSLENAPALSTLAGIPMGRLNEIAARVKERIGVEPLTY
jgi:wyosine [tRNA(Phe)-imidazoG37] synthetase (radical SAM superfamily)